MNSNAVQGLLSLLEAVQSLMCPVCEHPMKLHIDAHGCEQELGDAWVTGNQASAPTVLMAQGPCGCNVDELEEDYPDFAKVLEALRNCGSGGQVV